MFVIAQRTSDKIENRRKAEEEKVRSEVGNMA
jgi:hypothetical protein